MHIGLASEQPKRVFLTALFSVIHPNHAQFLKDAEDRKFVALTLAWRSLSLGCLSYLAVVVGIDSFPDIQTIFWGAFLVV